MPPPAKKKRKTANGSVPAGSRRTTRSQRPSLSIEIIAKVASFAAYGNDLMNICKAVGPRGCADIRFTCLRNNLDFLRQALQSHAGKLTTESRNATDSHNACVTKLRAWLKINSDWTKHCSAELCNNDELATASFVEESGRHVRKGNNPLILFNNPAVAIEFGFSSVLSHLVESVGIDINRSQWNGYFGKASVVANQYKDTPCTCFDYLASRRELDPFADVLDSTSSDVPLWLSAFEIDDFGIKCFEAIIRHGNFDTNGTIDIRGHRLLPLQVAVVLSIPDVRRGLPVQDKIKKVKVLLKHGADPGKEVGGVRSPLELARSGLEEFEEGSDERELYRELITIMEDHVTNK